MKIRNGFVTNSSSSSFILAYNEEELVSSLWKQLCDVYGEIQAGKYLGYIMDFLNGVENKASDIDEAINDYEDGIYCEESYALRKELEENKNFDYSEAREYVYSEEGEAEIERRTNEAVKKLKENLKDFDTVKDISISDSYQPLIDLECEVVKHLKECKFVINNH